MSAATVYMGMPGDEYYAHPALSQSRIKTWAKPGQKGPTGRALEVGTAVHTILLEGSEAFQARYGAKDARATTELNLATKEGKQSREAWEKAHPGMVYLKPSEQRRAFKLSEAFESHPTCRGALDNAKAKELSIIGKIEGIPLDLKCRIDLVTKNAQGNPVIVDIKTTGCTNREEFKASLIGLGYHVQAAWYVDLFRAGTDREYPFSFLCISHRTGEVWPHRMSHEEIAHGRYCYKQLLELYQRYELKEAA